MNDGRDRTLREDARREAYQVARSNLTALQATLPDFSTLSYTEVLLALEAATDLAVPAVAPVDADDRGPLYVQARAAVELLAEHGNRLAIELVIADLDTVWADDVRTVGLGALP